MLRRRAAARPCGSDFPRKERRHGRPMRFDGQHVVVTGAARGIGAAIARRLAAEGARLTLVDRDAGGLEDVAGRLGARAAVVDVRDADGVRQAVSAAAEERGRLDGLVANAGIGGPNEPGAGDRFDELVETNLAGTYRCCRAAEPHLPDGGRIVVTASILGRIGVAGYTGYCASKAGLLGLVRALAAELAPRRIQVNAVCPGWVDTDMSTQGLEALARELGGTVDQAHAVAMQAVPLGRMGTPGEIAATVAWLLSADAVGITGQGVDHNGGAWMG